MPGASAGMHGAKSELAWGYGNASGCSAITKGTWRRSYSPRGNVGSAERSRKRSDRGLREVSVRAFAIVEKGPLDVYKYYTEAVKS